LTLDGFTRQEILAICTTPRDKGGPGWVMSDSAVKRYITKAHERIQAFKIETGEKVLKHEIQRTERLLKSCLKTKDKRTAVAVLKELHELQGCKIQRIQHSGDPENPVQVNAMLDVNLKGLSDEELKALQQISEKIKGNEDQNTKPGGN